MPIDWLKPLPYQTADLPGIGGEIKRELDDFIVEEIAAYEPTGQGEFLYLWIEKRDMGAEFFVRQVARRLGIRAEEVGLAGFKDRRAVTRQWISVPLAAEAVLGQLEGEGMQVLKVSRHGNKLRTGHLHGNRFTIRIRDVAADAGPALAAILERIRGLGPANFYGAQRFGHDGQTLEQGLELLRTKGAGFKRGRLLRKLALSAVQSALFNEYLARRLNDRFLHKVLPGDVMAKWPFGGMFVAEDVVTEQARFDRREIVSAGPMFGRKMFPSKGLAAEREAALLADAELTPASFQGFGKLLLGTRRHNLVYVDDLSGECENGDAVLTFSLPAGSYATVLLREVMKT